MSAGIGVQRGAKAWQIRLRLRLYSDLAIVIQDDQEKLYIVKKTHFLLEELSQETIHSIITPSTVQNVAETETGRVPGIYRLDHTPPGHGVAITVVRGQAHPRPTDVRGRL